MPSIKVPELYSVFSGGGGVGGGRGYGQSPINSLFARQQSLRNSMAEQQLKLIQEELNAARSGRRRSEAREQRETADASRLRKLMESAQRHSSGMRSAEEARRADPGVSGRAILGMNKSRMTESPFANRNMANWLNFIGPEAAHAGLMQWGRLMGTGSVRGGYGGGGGEAEPGPDSPYTYMRGSEGAMPRGFDPYAIGGINQGMPPAGPNALGAGRYTNANLPSRAKLPVISYGGEKGGKVPKTGPYKLHKDEVVLSADQVDEQLMALLEQDKLNKMQSGQMDGKGTGPGKSYQEGTLEDLLRYDPFMPRSLQLGRPDPPGLMSLLPELSPEAEERLRELDPDRFESPEIAPAAPEIPETQPDFAISELMNSLQAQDELSGGIERGNEATFARARGGDYGSPDDPLTITGDPSIPLQNTVPGQDPLTGLDPNLAPEDQIFNPQSKAWREAEHRKFMAITSRTKAEKMRDYLLANGAEIDPQQAAMVDKQAGVLEKTVANYDKGMEQKREQTEKRRDELGKLVIAFKQAEEKNKALQAESSREAMRESRERLEDRVHEIMDEMSKEQDKDGRQRLAAGLAQAISALEGRPASDYFEMLAKVYDFNPKRLR